MRVLLTEIEKGSWGWRALDDDGTQLTCGFAKSEQGCMLDLASWYDRIYSVPIAKACECGSQALYKPFAPGHGHWCPVAACRIEHIAPP